MRNKLVPVSSLLLLLLSSAFVSAQTNLLKNPNADEGLKHWRVFGKATVDEATGAFIIRNGGYLIQDVNLPADTAGQYAVLIGRAASERINAGGAITGLPYLYGYMMNAGDRSGGRIYAYLQGQHMLSSSRVENEWVYLWGIFPVAAGTERISFFLQQAEAKGVPHNDSAARFDDLALYIFPTQEEASAFVGSTTMSAPKVAARLPKTVTKCNLAAAPELYGMRLGMSDDNVFALFPGIVQRGFSRSGVRESPGFTWLIIDPHKQNADPRYAGVKQFALRTRDGSVFSIDVDFTRSEWKNVDEFISSYTAELGLPALDAWEQVEGSMSKYILCNGFEVRFFLAQRGTPNLNYILIADTVKEKLATETIR